MTAEHLPGVGPPGDRLYLQGKCRVCRIPLFGRQPETRDLCGEETCARGEPPAAMIAAFGREARQKGS
jgi:hypothetical protein